MRISIPSITPRALLDRPTARVVDLRSPSEFAEDHVPGAVNVPLFDDVQRALVGTLFVQDSPEEAFRAARTIVREKIDELVGGIAAATGWTPQPADLRARVDALTGDGYERMSSFLVRADEVEAPPDPIVFHCWRGGLRSRSVLHFVRELGLAQATLLDGGYKSYRAEVLRQLAEFEAPPTFVLRGLTGVGKTLVLREIERLVPGLTIDLEGLAGHRSSLLGMIGLEPCSQKMFDSLIAARLRDPMGPLLFVEGESRKVGDVIVPPRLWHALEKGTNIELAASGEHRIGVLKAAYLSSPKAFEQLRRQLPLVEARMPKKFVGKGLVPMMEDGRIDELVQVLLEHYYDPLYHHSQKGKSVAERFDATNPTVAATECIEWCLARLARVRA